MPGGNARLSEHSWGADAHATEAALSMVRGVDQCRQSSEFRVYSDQCRRIGLGDAVNDVRDLAIALVERAVDSVVFGLAAVAPHLLGGRR